MCGAAIGALVGADALEGADAVVQRVREHVLGGGVPGHERAVEPDRVDLLDAHIRFVPTRVDEHKLHRVREMIGTP